MSNTLACTPAWNSAVSRRAALRGAALGSIALMTCNRAAHAAESHIHSTFGSGFCNLNFYLTNALQTAQPDGLILDFVPTPTFAEQVTFLGAGTVDAGLMPYTSFVALYDAGAPVKIVAGGGIEGCILVAQPGLDSPENSRARLWGPFSSIRSKCCHTTGSRRTRSTSRTSTSATWATRPRRWRRFAPGRST